MITEHYGQLNSYATGFEGNTKRIEELRRLHITEETLVAERAGDYTIQSDLSVTKQKLMYVTRVYFICSTDTCSNLRFKAGLVQTDDHEHDVFGPFKSPSLSWRYVPYRYGGNHLLAEHNSEFRIDKSIIDYLMYPPEIDIAGYTKFDGTASKRVDCVLPEILQENIIDRAVLKALAPIPDTALGSLAQVSQPE